MQSRNFSLAHVMHALVRKLQAMKRQKAQVVEEKRRGAHVACMKDRE